MAEQKKKIRILPNGPYEVTGDIPLKQSPIGIDHMGTSLHWQHGPAYPENDAYCLCRCGHAKDKPFCDGTHKEIGFEGAETAGHEPYLDGCVVYQGETVDLYDNESLCASLRFCDRGARVWNAAIDSADPEMRQLAIEEACDCAAGRLTVVDKQGNRYEPDLPQEIDLVEDTAAGWKGPLRVTGGIQLEGADGQSYEVRNRMTLCRCGESSNMPYCDTSHLSCPHMRGLDEQPGTEASTPPPEEGNSAPGANL